MDTKKRARRNLLQNVIIFALSLSAVLLFVRTQTDYLSSGRLLTDAASRPAQAVSELTDLAVPVRIAVAGAYGRSGGLWLTTAEDPFAAPGTLLGEALGSAGAVSVCGQADFRAALGGASVYYDFKNTLPLPVLAGLVGAGPAEAISGLTARSLLLAAGQDGVTLYLSGEDGCSRCSTAVTGQALSKLVNSYQLGNVSFAFELGEAGAALEPSTLLLTGELPVFPQLTVSNPLSDSESLLTALSFNPHTQNRYPESNGTEVIVEGDRTVRIQPDGTVLYQGGSDADLLTIPAAGTEPSDVEAVLGVSQLLEKLTDGLSGDASLYLQGIRHTGTTRVLSFGYAVRGAPIRRGSGSPAAEVTLSGVSVAGFSLYLRQYRLGEQASRLLPLRQAMAIAGAHDGSELAICYVDDGGSSAPAQWLAE